MITIITFGQTEFSGGIYSNSTWTKENSPYIITGDVVIFPSRTLTIEPGVEIRFNGRYYLEIRGRLDAIGTEKDSIVFTSNMDKPQKMDWIGTRLTNIEYARASFEYCKFSYADIANEVQCCWGSNVIYFKNCSFRSNNIAMMGYYESKIYVDHCEFRKNTIGILDGEKSISYSSFIENDYGLYNASGADASNSTFVRNGVAYHGMRGIIRNCLIAENDTGVAPYFTNPDIIHSIITNNRIGIQIQGLYENEPGIVQDCKICNNEIHNVELLNDVNIDLTSNCWCEPDSLKIAEKIYDGYDDIFLGLASFGLHGIDCENFVLTNNEVSGVEIIDFKIYPNPVLHDLNIECESCDPEHVKNGQIIIYNSIGQCILIKSVSFSTSLNLDLSHFKPGIYILNIMFGEQLTKQVIVKI